MQNRINAHDINRYPDTDALQARQILIQTARGFYEKNWMLGTSGNLSLRLTSSVYIITLSGRDKGALTEDDFAVVTAGGQVLGPSGAKSSAETMLHEAVYRNLPEVQAVYHVHTIAATFLSQQLGPHEPLVFSDLEMLKGLGRETHETALEIPIIENTQDIHGLGEVLHQHLQPEVPGFLLRGHGIYTWGRTPSDAKRHVEIWEFLFQYKLNELLLKR